LLDTVSILEPNTLERNEWRFVSYPAQLMAMSMLTAMSNTDSRVFDPDFWYTGGACPDRLDEQRGVLKEIENRREKHHLSQAEPIRFIYVAWSIIKYEGKILFFQREDTRRRFDVSRGDYGLVGGRVKQIDILGFEGGKKELVRELQSLQSELMKNAIPEALKREICEETKMVFKKHYSYNHLRTLKPSKHISGAAPVHALTEYHFDLHTIELTLEGYVHLQNQIKIDEKLVWIPIGDVVQGNSCQYVLYLKSLFSDFGGDKEALREELEKLPDSFTNNYNFYEENYGFIFLVSKKTPLERGVYHVPLAVDNLTALNDKQRLILLALAGHLKGFEITSKPDDITFLPFGWVKVPEVSEKSKELQNLFSILEENKIPIESIKNQYFRLSINPECIFFDQDIFSLSVRPDHETEHIILKRKAIETALGVATSVQKVLSVDNKIAKEKDKALAKKICSLLINTNISPDIIEPLKKSLWEIHRKKLRKQLHELGLRGFLREKNGEIKAICNIEKE